MAIHNELGKSGEDAAVRYLEDNGYKILHRNWSRGSFELDIVARYGDELVVLEIKTRSSNEFSNPEDAVTKKKINHIVAATDFYIKYYQIDLPVRFDIIAVLGKEFPFTIDHIEDAFYPPLQRRAR